MELDIADGLLIGAQLVQSPNQDARPENTDIELLVIHNISLPPGEYGSPAIRQFFLNELDTDAHPFYGEIAELRVSSHLLIDRLGEVVQFVPFGNRAWHAGKSLYCGRSNCNDYSIGIELEGTDFENFTQNQYATLTEVTKLLLSVYPAMSADKIVGHSDIAPGRKTDPGPCFDWGRYRRALAN